MQIAFWTFEHTSATANNNVKYVTHTEEVREETGVFGTAERLPKVYSIYIQTL